MDILEKIPPFPLGEYQPMSFRGKCEGKGGKIKETKGKYKLKGKINAKGAIIKLERVCEK